MLEFSTCRDGNLKLERIFERCIVQVIYSAGCTRPTWLMILPDVDHTFAYRDAADSYRARVIPFLNEALLRV
jgi:hypothetical protein